MRKTKAFTLIEIMVVLALIGILASLIITPLLILRVKARNARNKAVIATLSGTVDRFVLEHGAAIAPNFASTQPFLDTPTNTYVYRLTGVPPFDATSPITWLFESSNGYTRPTNFDTPELNGSGFQLYYYTRDCTATTLVNAQNKTHFGLSRKDEYVIVTPIADELTSNDAYAWSASGSLSSGPVVAGSGDALDRSVPHPGRGTQANNGAECHAPAWE